MYAQRTTLFSSSYFLLFFSLGCLYPFLNAYLMATGLSGTQVGLMSSAMTVMALVAQPLWGALTDWFRIRRLAYACLAIGTGAVAILVPQAAGLSWLFVAIVLMSFLRAPLNPLLDSIVLEGLGTDDARFGRLRLWGSLGWSLSTYLTGRLADQLGQGVVFSAFAISLVATAAAAFRLPEGTSRKVGTTKPRVGASTLLGNRRLFLFLLAILLMQVGHQAGISFFTIYAQSIQASMTDVGMLWAVGALIEIPIFYLCGRWVNRYGTKNLLVLSALLYGVMMYLYTLTRTPLQLMVVQMIDGVAFPLFLTSAVLCVNGLVPEEWRATGQAMFAAVSAGLSGIAGSLMGGWLYDWVGLVALYRVAAGLSVIAAVFMGVLLRDRTEGTCRYSL